MTTPKVSIGMPVYNGEPFIREALDSILTQTFTDFELIISDNASTDGTEVICRDYATKDDRLRYIRHPKNRGVIANFKFVLDEAVGEYFMWAAADDKIKPMFIERLYNILHEDENLVLVMSDVLNISPDGSFLKISKLDNIRIREVQQNWIKIRSIFFENPTSQVFFCVYGLFKTQTIKKVDLNYKNRVKYLAGSEIPLLAQVALLGKIGSTSEVMKVYRRIENSVYNNEKKSTNLMKMLDNHLNLSFCLALIVKDAKLPFAEKIKLFQVIAYKCFSRLIKGTYSLCYRKLRRLARSHFIALA
ncbi:glycosyltransferase family 2 protein [Coleofasciculus chthonoplastes]|uniref:glycosyltransferase family 2 protein n=1 Tax=Coleofasciculus chthonoplastes TaxID=64178 RepID=UPI0032FB3B5C